MSATFQSQHRNFCLYLDSPPRRIEGTEIRYGQGVKCQFVNGVFNTNDAKLAERLRKHSACGVTFHEVLAEKVPDPARAKSPETAAGTAGKPAA